MKMQLASDLHLEFPVHKDLRIKNVGADILILSGDICVVEHFQRSKSSPYFEVAQNYKDFFKTCSEEFDKVFVVMGNHEHYRGYIDTTVLTYDEVLSEYPNIELMDDSFVDYNGYRFVGGTLWTDLNKDDPLTPHLVGNAMNDYHVIQWSYNYRKLKPEETAAKHRFAKAEFAKAVQTDLPVVMMTHHAPSTLSIHPKYKNDYHINGAYASDLSNFMLDNDNIKIWTHGHVHSCWDYEIGSCRILANPHGYGDENPEFDSNKVWEF